MKKLEFKTSKGEFLIVDLHNELPFGDDEIHFNVDSFGYLSEMTEEQFAEVVDSIKWRYTSGGSDTVYRNYLCNNEISGSGVIESAKESFESLIKSLEWYLWDNPHGSPSTCSEAGDYSLWSKAESKTFYNPILLKKI